MANLNSTSQDPNFPDVLWPTTLRIPKRPPRLVYLDLNHWITLSKAYSGHIDGKRHRASLDFCRKAVNDRKAVFPISEYIYAEIAKITNHRQRRNLRQVIEQVGRYMVVAPLGDVVTHEVEAILDHMVGPSPKPLSRIDYLDWGVARAFGMVGGFRIKSASGTDVTDEIRRVHPIGAEAFDKTLLRADIELNRKVIEGPSSQEEPQLRKQGWNQAAVVQMYEQTASDERAQVQRFNNFPKWRRGRTRDVIAVREAIAEISPRLVKGFAARGRGDIDGLIPGNRDELRSMFDAIPSANVAVTLKTSLHRDSNYKWRNNDIYDIRALSLTIPYCDVVVTDGSMWSHVTRHELPNRYDTVVISQLAELSDHI